MSEQSAPQTEPARLVGHEHSVAQLPTLDKLRDIEGSENPFPDMRMEKSLTDEISRLWLPDQASAEIAKFKKKMSGGVDLQEVGKLVVDLESKPRNEKLNLLSSGDESLKPTIELLLGAQEQIHGLDEKTKLLLKELQDKINTLPDKKKKEIFDILRKTDAAGGEMWASLQQVWSLNAREDDAKTFGWLAANSDERDPDRPKRAGGLLRKAAASISRSFFHPDQEIITTYGGTKGYARALEANCREQVIANSENPDVTRSLMALNRMTEATQGMVDNGLLTSEEFTNLQAEGLKPPTERAEWYEKRFHDQGVAESKSVQQHKTDWEKGNWDRLKNLALDPIVTAQLSTLAQSEAGKFVLGAQMNLGRLELNVVTPEKYLIDQAVHDLAAAVVLKDQAVNDYSTNTSDVDAAGVLRGAEKYYSLRVKDSAAVVDRLGSASAAKRMFGIVDVGWMKMWGGLLSKEGSVEASATSALKERSAKLMRTDKAVEGVTSIDKDVAFELRHKMFDLFRAKGVSERFYNSELMQDYLDSGVWGAITKGLYKLTGANEDVRGGGFVDTITWESRARTAQDVFGVDLNEVHGVVWTGESVESDGLFDRMTREAQLAIQIDEKLNGGEKGQDDLILRATLETTKAARTTYVEQEFDQMKTRESLDERWKAALKRAGKAGVAVGAAFGAIYLSEAFAAQAASTLEQAKIVAENLAKELATIESFKAASTSLELMRNYALEHAQEFVNMYINQLQGAQNPIVEFITQDHGLEKWFSAWSLGKVAMQGVALSAGLLSASYGAGSVLAGLGATGENLRNAVNSLRKNKEIN